MNRTVTGPLGPLLLMALLLSGCAANVVTDYDESVAFGQYDTWAFAPRDDKDYQSLDATRIEAAVERELAGEALTKASQDEADLLLSYRIQQVERLDTSGFSYGLGFGGGAFGWGLATRPPAREIQEGQLVLELVDSETDRVVWRAASKRYLNQDQSPETRKKLINEVVTEMFSRYPPGK
ncbi:protein of unknown function [Marinobacter daqiaonensis]|uniref:DUF4136 domain-containing protein n=1 Tax=Marinobacter daqiaonensis TaxID=650891 RepID=A0A1I6HLR3_9GAMM|nr:DUF4136 domain-containing protein [Marinobacter daqiaonensis]SFR55220.1 protein of unknown function [Marinobacter daqiaonensis]